MLCVTKNQFYFFFVFQKYVNWTTKWPKFFKLSFQKDTCLFWLRFFLMNGRPWLTLKSWENWIEDKMRVHSYVNMQHGSVNFQTLKLVFCMYK